MNEPIAPLPPEAKQVLREAQASAPEPTAEQADRLLGRLQSAMGSAAVAPAAAAGGAMAGKLIAVAIAAALAGLGGGVWLGRTYWAPPPQIVERETVKVVEVRVPVPVETEPAAPAAPRPKPPSSAPAPAIDELLARERELIDTARSALMKSNAQAAIAAVQAHATQFPSGRLAEERESLWVQALMLRGDADAARARAREFHEQFPKSLLGPTVDAAVSQ